MINLKTDLAVQSFCFRNFKSHEALVEKVKEIGLDKVELCGVHVDFADDSKFQDIVHYYRESGVGIVSIGVQTFTDNETAERKFFEFARLAGCKFMSANFAVNKAPEAFQTAEKLAGEYGIKLGIHNHGGYHWLGSQQMLAHVFSKVGENIGLCLDTAWALDAKMSPVDAIEKFGNRLYGIHFKDFIYDRARNHQDVVVGTGNIDLAELMAALKKIDFNGYGVLEYEGDADNPVPALRECVERIQATCD